jgi:exosortase
MIYQDREKIFVNVQSTWLGGAAVTSVGAMLLWAADRLHTSDTIADWLSVGVTGMVALWWGGFLILYGRRAFVKALFPLLFLCFTIPVPGVVIDAATQALKASTTELVAVLFVATGTPVHRADYVFSLPGFAIEIADACSGIRSSIALVLTSLLAGYMFLQSVWSRSLVVLAVLPITIIKNAVRIVTLSLLAIHVDGGFLTGQLHHEGGIVFFMLALLLLAPLFALIRRYDALQRDRASASAQPYFQSASACTRPND